MDGKRRQYVPPALGGSPASTAATTAAAVAADAAAKRLISLRNSARPPEPSLPTQTSPNAQALREQAVADIRQRAPSLNSGSSQVFLPTARDGGHSDSATNTTAFAATGLPRTGHPSSSEMMPQSPSWHLTARPPPKAPRSWTPPTLSLRRPSSAATIASHPTGEVHERSYAITASANLSPQHVFLSSSSPTPPPSDAPGSAVEPRRDVLGLGGDAAGCSDVVGLASVSQAGLKRPRDFGASAPPSMSNGVGAGLGEGSATRPLAAWRGLLPRPGVGDASTAPQPQHPLGLASLHQHAFSRLNRATTASDEEADQATFNRETEDEDAVADDETGEEDGGGGRRSVVQSDPLRVVVDFAEVRRAAARSKTAAAAAASSDGALQQAEEAEAMLTDAQKGSESHRHAKQDNASRCSLEAERDARDVASARAFLEKRAWADVHRRATQAATTPAPPSELLLDLLQHLPTTPGRAIYDRSSCPPTAAASGFDEDFHKCVQQLMTQIVLQRDGRIGDAKLPSVSLADAAAAQQDSASLRHRSRMQRKGAKQKQKEGEVEQLVEAVERGIADDVRDVVAYARFLMQERLHQEQRKVSERLSSPSKTAVEESEGNFCPDGDMRAPEQQQQLAELRAVVEKKLSLMRAAAESTDKGGESESATLRTKRAQSTRGSEDDANGIPGATDAALQDSKAVFAAAHRRFMDVVRSAAASRREKVEAAQAAEQRLEATVAAWRKSYDKLLTRELSRHCAGKRPDKQSRTEALLQAMQPQQEKHQKRQHHRPPTGLWEMTKGMHKKERKHLSKLVKAAANVLPLPPFQYPPAPPHFSP
ncbi:hypothetical protein CGC21_13450 [Leishmania donovani]|uniref:Uncharacterized protein n=1 Tax=Leishmania donovani TaxID=5661 RepID=A0A504XQD5_LEIDO|nr:hypothetical protein CGC21_13450 [Leishmania donovani]